MHCLMEDCERKSVKITHINSAINSLDCDLRKLRVKQSFETSFRARVNWYEHGEKSSKYLINLNKKYKKQTLIEHITCDGVSCRGQKEVSDGITQFYQHMYRSEDVISDEDGFYDNCPKLSDASREQMECELADEDLLAALNTCSDSAPGPDGISYSVYKKLWEICGPIILE